MDVTNPDSDECHRSPPLSTPSTTLHPSPSLSTALRPCLCSWVAVVPGPTMNDGRQTFRLALYPSMAFGASYFDIALHVCRIHMTKLDSPSLSPPRAFLSLPSPPVLPRHYLLQFGAPYFDIALHVCRIHMTKLDSANPVLIIEDPVHAEKGKWKFVSDKDSPDPSQIFRLHDACRGTPRIFRLHDACRGMARVTSCFPLSPPYSLSSHPLSPPSSLCLHPLSPPSSLHPHSLSPLSPLFPLTPLPIPPSPLISLLSHSSLLSHPSLPCPPNILSPFTLPTHEHVGVPFHLIPHIDARTQSANQHPTPQHVASSPRTQQSHAPPPATQLPASRSHTAPSSIHHPPPQMHPTKYPQPPAAPAASPYAAPTAAAAAYDAYAVAYYTQQQAWQQYQQQQQQQQLGGSGAAGVGGGASGSRRGGQQSGGESRGVVNVHAWQDDVDEDTSFQLALSESMHTASTEGSARADAPGASSAAAAAQGMSRGEEGADGFILTRSSSEPQSRSGRSLSSSSSYAATAASAAAATDPFTASHRSSRSVSAFADRHPFAPPAAPDRSSSTATSTSSGIAVGPASGHAASSAGTAGTAAAGVEGGRMRHEIANQFSSVAPAFNRAAAAVPSLFASGPPIHSFLNVAPDKSILLTADNLSRGDGAHLGGITGSGDAGGEISVPGGGSGVPGGEQGEPGGRQGGPSGQQEGGGGQQGVLAESRGVLEGIKEALTGIRGVLAGIRGVVAGSKGVLRETKGLLAGIRWVLAKIRWVLAGIRWVLAGIMGVLAGSKGDLAGLQLLRL
ncbi:unnamed protein product [Closterium sp. Naga37s-1]|nr:unnamed protein product [Closterium sp. Naga37s-1]